MPSAIEIAAAAGAVAIAAYATSKAIGAGADAAGKAVAKTEEIHAKSVDAISTAAVEATSSVYEFFGGVEYPDNYIERVPPMAQDYVPVWEQAEYNANIPPYVLACICKLESDWGRLQLGDGGHAHGLFHFHDRWNPKTLIDACIARDVLVQSVAAAEKFAGVYNHPVLVQRYNAASRLRMAFSNHNWSSVVSHVLAGNTPDYDSKTTDFYGSRAMNVLVVMQKRGYDARGRERGTDATG